MSEICTLCAELEGNFENNLLYLLFGGKLRSRILRQTPNFVVMPTIGPLVKGHLLIVTKKHYLSMGHLPESMYQELSDLSLEIRKVLTDRFYAPVFFEHGPISQTKTGGACVDHAHMHAVPAPLDLRADLKKYFQERRIDALIELQDQIRREMAYIFYEDTHGNKYVYDVDETLPCQFMRRLIASKLGLGNRWDWRLYPAKQELLDTLRLLASWSGFEVLEAFNNEMADQNH
jgi:diadenosine tetraphosphate (Ap4A) HIT family hydrolase